MKKRILIVDDKAENIALANRQLGSFCTLLTAKTFSAAKAVLATSKNTTPLDAVFTDVMLIGEPYGVSEENPEIGKEVPYGLVIALMALNKGIKAVSLVSDLSHHAGPIAWALDNIGRTGLAVSRTYSKDWLDAYFFWFGNPPETAQKEEAPAKKRLLIVDHDEEIYKSIITIEETATHQRPLFINSQKEEEIVACISNRECTHILHWTELHPEAKKKAPKYYGKKLHDLILGLASPTQLVAATGFMNYKGPEKYLRQPFSPETLWEFLDQ